MIENEIEKIVENFGAKLYDTELEKSGDAYIYRVLIMMEGGVKLEICEKVSRVLSPLLDLNPPTRGQYYLEVSSPGIERKLTKPDHYRYSIGEMIKLKVSNDGKIKGKLRSVDGSSITLEMDDGSVIQVLFSDIHKAKTYFEWKN